MNKVILVTGVAGFIGSHVAQGLMKRGDKVVGIDNFNNYYSPERKHANVAEIRRSTDCPDSLELLAGDIRDTELVDRLFAQRRFDAVIHLAALPGVRASTENPRLYYDVNLMGTLNLLEAARRYQPGNFVFASTSSVYGNTDRIPFVETDPCDRPLAPYPASKRAGEILGYTYQRLTGLPFTSLRFFTVYGPRNRPDMMAHMVADNLRFGRRVALYNRGLMYRDWTYVDDIVQGVLAAADRPLGYEIINLGRGQPVLLADFISVLENLAGRKADLQPGPMPDSDMLSTHADVGKARRLLGYDPQVSVTEGAARFWQWHQENVT